MIRPNPAASPELCRYHPVFGATQAGNSGAFNNNIQSSGFGRVRGVTNESSGDAAGFGRIIEIRANVEF